MIMLLFTANYSSSGNDPDAFSNVSISFEVGLNGRVFVADANGLLDDDGPPDDEASPGTQSAENCRRELHSKLAHVLETSQDIGIFVEWVLRRVRQRKSRG